MHAVLEGVTRWLANRWFDSKFHASPFYLGRQIRKIDSELLQQRPPHEFSRPPRSIDKHLKYWKASELRNWLLFYSLPLLLSFLPSLYWHHYALLVSAMHIMLGDNVTHAQVDAADQMLVDFCMLLPDLYGESSCTANAHLLLHLAKYVRLWGPLWTHSSFGFESKNGRLKHLFHGNSNIVPQLLFNIDVCYTLQHMHPRLVECESEQTMNYIDHLSNLTPRSNMMSIGSHTYIIGQLKVTKPTTEQAVAFGCADDINVFSKMLKDRVLYHSISYPKSATGKRNNTHCCYRDKINGTIHFGQIELFITSPTPSALVRRLQPSSISLINKAGHPCRTSLRNYQQIDLLSSYIIPLDPYTDHCQLVAVPVSCIISKVLIISVSGNRYCILQPNNIERH